MGLKVTQKLMEADIPYLQESIDFAPDIFVSDEVAAAAREIATMHESESGKGDGWETGRISWKSLRREAGRAYRELREANPSSAFGQLFRVGTQLIANGWAKRYPSTYMDIAETVQSSNRQEFYPPMWGSDFADFVQEGKPFREGRVEGQDVEIINLKVGKIEAFRREFFDDDQTRQISQRQQKLGESIEMTMDAYFSRRFFGAADSTSFKFAIPATNWPGTVNYKGTAVTTPFSVDMYDTSVGNRPATYGDLTGPNLLTAQNALRQAKDPLGAPIQAIANTLMVSTAHEEKAKALLMSDLNPFVIGTGATTADTAVTGVVGGIMMKNTLKGRYNLVVPIFLKQWAWAIGVGKQGMINQVRDAMEIVQEVPNSGDSFNFDNIRFRSRKRQEIDWLDPRYWYAGNDGSVSGTQ